MRTFFLFGFLSIFFSFSTFSQSVELNLFYTKKTEAFSKGDLNEAIVWGSKAVAKAKEEFGDSEVYANYASDLGQVYFQLAKYSEARKLYEEVIKIYQAKLGPYHVYTAVTQNNLGNLYRLTGENNLALAAYKNSLEGYRQSLTSKHEYYAMTLNTMIAFCQEAKLNNELEVLYRNERGNAEENSAEYVAWTNNLAMLLEEVEKISEAELLYKECLEIVQKNKSEFEEEYPTLNANLGHFYLKQNRLDEAQRYMERSIVPEHESYATHLNNLGMVFEKKRQFDKALATYTKALDHLSKAGGDTTATFRLIAYNASSSLSEAGQYRETIKLVKATLKKGNSKDMRLLNDLAIAYENVGEYQRSDSVYGKVLSIPSTAVGYSEYEHNRSVAGRADVWRIQGKLKEAETLLISTIKAAKKDSVANASMLITLRHNLAYLYKTMGDFGRAESLSRSALAQHVALHGKDVEYANMLKNYGSLHMDLIQYEKAEQFIKEAMVIEKARPGDKSDAYSTSLNQLGLVYFYQGRYNESKICTEQSLKLKEINLGKEHEHYANGLVNLANVLMAEGLFEQAEPLYREAEKIYKNSTGTKTKNYANILHALSKVKSSIGFYSQAEKLLFQTLSVQQEVLGRNHPDYANALNSLGMLHREIDEYDKADSAYSVSLELRKAAGGEQSYAYAQSLNNIADLYVFMGRHREAAKLYEQCLLIAQNTVGKDHPDYATYLNNIGQAYFKGGNYKDAQRYLEQSLALREKIYGKHHLLVLEVKSNLAVTLEAVGKGKESEKIFENLNEEYLDYIFKKFPHLTENEKTSFYSTVNYHFESFTSFALRRSKEDPAILGQLYDIQLATKALLLNSSKKVKDVVLQSGDEKLKVLYNTWLSKREYLAKIYSLPESEVVIRGINIKKLETQSDSLERALGLSSPLFANAYQQNRLSWKDVRKNLKPGEAAVEMCRFYLFEQAWIDSLSYAALILKNESDLPEAVVFSDGRQMESRFLKYYKGTIKAKIDDRKSWENYWSPLQMKLQGVKKIYFAPDGVYNEINLNTLTDSTGHALIDQLSIHIVTTTKEIVPLKTKRVASGKTILVGRPSFRIGGIDPDGLNNRGQSGTRTSRWLEDASFADLPGTQREVEEIAAILKKSSPVEIYMGENAREEVIKKTSDARILHIATHGFFIAEQVNELEKYKKYEDNFSNPLLRSGIVLAGVENVKSSEEHEDGILTAMEACNLRLENTDLVVMSACETGLGEVRYGEGVYGLQRAFRIAGAKAMIMSLWKVDDQATQEMMVQFYTHWTQGSDMRTAFGLAQKEIREKYKSPFYWGAFVLLGE